MPPRDRKTEDLRDPVASLVVYEDDDVVLINKPPGMLTASGPRDTRETLWRIMRARGCFKGLQMGIIHRLDKDASGLLVFSKNDNAYHSLKTQFFRHTVERIYMTIVAGKPAHKSGTIRSHLIEWDDGTVHPTHRHGVGELAISHYELCSVQQEYALVRVKLETGRKHQIRVHLASLGSPIVGDEFYGSPQRRNRDRELELMLVALRLCFSHPRTGQRMEFEIDLPEHMRAFLRSLTPENPKKLIQQPTQLPNRVPIQAARPSPPPPPPKPKPILLHPGNAIQPRSRRPP